MRRCTSGGHEERRQVQEAQQGCQGAADGRLQRARGPGDFARFIGLLRALRAQVSYSLVHLAIKKSRRQEIWTDFRPEEA